MGVISYCVEQRSREIGIRMALEPAHHSRNMVVGQGMGLAAAGLVIGLGGAFWLTRLLASFLFGVTARDPVAFFATPLVLSAVALFAVWIPARRQPASILSQSSGSNSGWLRAVLLRPIRRLFAAADGALGRQIQHGSTPPGKDGQAPP
ncbi:MAG: hypothetical protein QM775_32460 [Pirellulales bacterium]